MKNLAVRLDEEGKRVICSFLAGAEPATPITLDDINQAVAAAGLDGCRLDDSALKAATAKCCDGTDFESVIGEAVDGTFALHVTTDQLRVYLGCVLPRGGTAVTVEDVLEKAKHDGIDVDLDLAAIEAVLGTGGTDILIASGKAPVSGTDGRLENLVPSAKERSPRLDEHGLADFRDLGEIPAVRAGDALMRRIPPTEGEPGLDVFGQEIPAKPGKDVSFAKHLKGAALHPEDPNLLVAAMGGSPVLLGNGVDVEPVYKVGDVDLRTGNIDFPGSVIVTGEIQTGMTIVAGGNINVGSTVEGVNLDAGGDIVVKGGIVGLTERGKTVHSRIGCRGSCNAYFVQNAHIAAGNGIFIRDFIMQSELTAAHQIIVGDKNSCKGQIIGGVTRAVALVKAQTLGSPARAKTVVVAGPDQALIDHSTTIAHALDGAMTKLIHVVKLLEIAHASPGRIPPQTVKAAEATRDAINEEMAALTLDQDQIKKEIAIAEQAQIIAERQFLEGVEIHFGSKCHRVFGDLEGGIARLQNGELVLD